MPVKHQRQAQRGQQGADDLAATNVAYRGAAFENADQAARGLFRDLLCRFDVAQGVVC